MKKLSPAQRRKNAMARNHNQVWSEARYRRVAACAALDIAMQLIHGLTFYVIETGLPASMWPNRTAAIRSEFRIWARHKVSI